MARFDLYRARDAATLLLDVQSHFLDHLETRIVVPLLAPARVPRPIRDLHPTFAIEDARFVMATQLMAAVRRRDLGRAVGNLEAERDAITRALDMLFTGF
jgi:toxin CcdB